ncbi:hypothetical protein [Italian clover phyllody phytoplasma]|uniref:hypothetical protein n=1 Tax=Italian clover phyllody phytoplasma TaxID=1196420 RepID=UPI0002D7EE46|nr:hypothetical protein [Italian clover phyllody phytoplasma]
MMKNKINALKTKLTKLKCKNIEIIQNNETKIKEINFDFKGIYVDLQFLKIEFYANANLRHIQCFSCRSDVENKVFTYDFYDENDPQAFKVTSFTWVPEVFKYLKAIGNILQHEYFIPIMDVDEEIIYNLISTKTLYTN